MNAQSLLHFTDSLIQNTSPSYVLGLNPGFWETYLHFLGMTSMQTTANWQVNVNFQELKQKSYFLFWLASCISLGYSVPLQCVIKYAFLSN